jgi:hypothetical protein
MAKNRSKSARVPKKRKKPTRKPRSRHGEVDHARPLATQSGDCESNAPVWDKDLMELRAWGRLIKRFKVPAKNQVLILDAFQELSWPSHIDDPLPPQPGRDSKRRLHGAIDRLNRNQINRLVRFRGDGNGRGILWERIADRSPIDRR